MQVAGEGTLVKVDARKPMGTRHALWPWGLVAWMATAFVVTAASTPAAGGCDDRAIVTAIAWGGLPAIALIGADVARRRKLWPGILLGCAIFATLAARGSSGRSPDGDCDQILGLMMTLTFATLFVVLIVGPVAAVYLVWRQFARLETHSGDPARPRKWRAEVKDRSLVITRRKPPG